MHLFFFNDCISALDNHHVFTQYLCSTIKEFNKLLDKDLEIERGIVTHGQPSSCFYGNSFSLQDAISAIGEKSLKELAFSLFQRFPIGVNNFDDTDDELLRETYECEVEHANFDGINLAIVAKNNGFLFTVATNKASCCHEMSVSVMPANRIIKIHNLYGEPDNTRVVEEEVRVRNQQKLQIFEKLIELLDAKYSKQFEKDFNNLSPSSKELIVNHFKAAINRNMSSAFSPDGDLIKDVTPSKPKCSVYELRVFKERALRVYFAETEKGIFLSNIGFKNNNQQDHDIKQAHATLYKLVLSN